MQHTRQLGGEGLMERQRQAMGRVVVLWLERKRGEAWTSEMSVEWEV